MDWTIRILGAVDGVAFERALDIYRAAIEPSEQRPEDELRGLILREDYLVLTAERGGDVIGFSIAWAPPEEDFWLLEYMAVAPQARGQGVGEDLFHQTRRIPDPGNAGLIEVDVAHDEKSARRLRFYERLRCTRVEGLSYQLPLRVAGTPPPMMVLCAPFYGPVSYLRRETLERALSCIYAEVYHQSPDDPRIAQMIAPLPMSVPLRGLGPAMP
jgi:GNAT superfamily N-acetyltransferase